MLEKLEKIKTDTLVEIKKISEKKQLEELRVRILGRKGELTSILRSLGTLAPEQRGHVGKQSNVIKSEIESALETRNSELSANVIDEKLKNEWIDVTLDLPTDKSSEHGKLHPITQIQKEIEDICSSMGFQILDGPEAESEYYNFEALNIPKHHPARDMQDTFWTEDGNLLRTHTSAIQVRGMENMEPPFQVVGPGRVFRYEATDASHENTFYQVEGMMVGKDISVSNLIYVMKELLREVFQREVKVRLRPGYFPFVEPGFELDINCLICGGKGCKVCKQTGWVELLPCGLVHPNVLKAGNIDPDKWSGFAFGLGLNRLVMMRYAINDIRHFQSGDIRFLRQF